jgi:hypothetical protein
VKATLIESDTMAVKPERLREESRDGFVFISVDAGHDASLVEHDMALAAAVLRPGGVIVGDDVYNATCPGVAEGTFRYLERCSDLACFATGYNKTLFTDVKSHDYWLACAREWAMTGENAMFERTRGRLKDNEAARWKPKLCGYEVVTFV